MGAEVASAARGRCAGRGSGSRRAAPPLRVPPSRREARDLIAPRRRRALAALVFLATFNAVLFVSSGWTSLYDTDSSYHVAVAREIARHGIPDALPWARFSALGEGFGDKELLFHVLLAPFVSLGDPMTGARVALAILNGAVAAALALLSMRLVGAWGALVPVWLALTACDLTLRTLRLRPEVLALLLLLLATVLAARRRWWLLGLVSFVFALSYTAVHALLGLALLFAATVYARERRLEVPLLAAPALGAVLGLLAHPGFPANLQIFWLQNVVYYQMKSGLDVGLEIQPATTLNVLGLNAGWIAGLLVLAASRRRAEGTPHEAAASPPPGAVRFADFTLVAALAFLFLFLFAMRFATYFVPFATLAVLARLSLDGGVAARARLPWRGSIPFAFAAAVPLLAVPYAFHLYRVNLVSAGVYVAERRATDESFARALPAGAKVAARWQNAETYVFAAPQARYLNLLDPVFMAKPFPAAYSAQRALFDGADPDPVTTAATVLDSDHVAFADAPRHRLLAERLEADPRAEKLVSSADVLYRLLPGANAKFVVAWRVAPEGTSGAGALGDASAWPAIPPPSGERARAFYAYVDPRPFAAGRCATLVHDLTSTADGAKTFELSPAGPTTLFVDGAWRLSTPGRDAVLGRGVTFPLTLSKGTHRIAIETCPGRFASGFYLVERSGPPVAGPVGL